MMDIINVAVLEKICSLASPGRYVVFSEDELEEALPEGGEYNSADLKTALKNLLTAGYIDIKYSSGNLFCIAPLKKYMEPEIQSPPPVPEKKREKEGARSPFFPAFFGGALGSLLVTLVFALLGYA